MKCYRCGKKSNQTWSICSDGNVDRHICDRCDVLLNEFVLNFMGFRNWKSKLKKYKKKMNIK